MESRKVARDDRPKPVKLRLVVTPRRRPPLWCVLSIVFTVVVGINLYVAISTAVGWPLVLAVLALAGAVASGLAWYRRTW